MIALNLEFVNSFFKKRGELKLTNMARPVIMEYNRLNEPSLI